MVSWALLYDLQQSQRIIVEQTENARLLTTDDWQLTKAEAKSERHSFSGRTGYAIAAPHRGNQQAPTSGLRSADGPLSDPDSG